MKQTKRNRIINENYKMCAYCQQPFSNNDIIEIHHGGVHDTKGSRKKYPMFIDSVINCYPMHKHCHEKNPGFGHIPENICEQIEIILQTIKITTKCYEEIGEKLLKEIKYIIIENK